MLAEQKKLAFAQEHLHKCANIQIKQPMNLILSVRLRFAAARILGLSAALSALGLASAALADDPAPLSSLDTTNSPARLPEVIVTGQKLPAPVESLPVSDSVVTRATLTNADIQSPRDASIYAPNTFLSEFSARAQSVPYFRGIGGGLGYNPGVTTFIDGVPQLNFYSANIELLDVDQVEFLRGPQGDLFGRNTAAGLINITSVTPVDFWTSKAVGSYGNYDYGDFRGSISGPIIENKLDMSLAGGYSSRDGYTTDQHGKGIDGRLAEFGKGQLLYKVSERFELRLISWGENDRDGDYALGELNDITADPHVAPREGGTDQGYNKRDIAAGVVQANYHGEAVDLTSISGASWWRNDALTDWDYTGSYAHSLGPDGIVPFYEDNIEQQRQFTQEFRAASSKEKPIQLADALELSWQSGLFLFSQSYHQLDSNFNNSLVAHTGALDDLGTGVYGQVKLTAWEHLDFTAGVRYDYENKTAKIGTVPFAPNTNSPVYVSPSANFGEVSPAFGLDWHFTSNQMVYARVAEGYKAGGFNSEGPAEYGTEHTWNYELGEKAIWLDGKLETTAALFYIDWHNIQESTFSTSPNNPYGYYIINTGGADSKGVELETKYRPLPDWDLFGSVGYTDARFQSDATYFGASIAGNRLPNAPEFTGNMGTEMSWSPCRAVTLYGRAELTVYGDFVYDPSNLAGQSTYSIANFRAGARGKNWFAEGWVDNAFNTSYVPIAFNLYDGYPGINGRTGYVGESGAPLTFGFRAGIYF
jgi:iron complex outermembrane receptor protein